MLRKRSRSKQALMADPNGKQSKAASFPRLFTAFRSFKSFTAENDAVASPTSILDPKPFSVTKNPKTRQPDPKPIGLAIVDSLLDEDKPEPGLTRTGSRTILFGSQLRIQIPETPRSPTDYGIKTRNNSHLNSFSGSGQDPVRIFTGYISASEMELSEDYTCVTSHGPNPRTIHIFDNFIVESQSDAVFFRIPDPGSENGSGHNSPHHFLSTCCTCKKNLGPREDIFMYRGERAFCSSECRSEEMMLEEPNMK